MAKIFIHTLGCPKNAIDSEGLGGMVVAGGHEVVEEPGSADVALVNTCGFIDPARRETVQDVLELAELKSNGLKGLLMTGCLVARSADDLAESLPEVDALVDFAAYPQIAQIIDDLLAGELQRRIHGDPGTRFDPAWWDASIAASPRLRFGRAPWAYLKIAEGCDRGCTFCAIPLMRGKFRSRSIGVIIDEARRLVELGVSELSLVSQDSVMWGRDTGEGTLVDLIAALETVDGLRRARLMYLHPQGVTDALIDRIIASDVVASYFDLSLQHVSPRVLKGMGRWGGAARFHRMIDRIRSQHDLAGIRATFIAGFPGETEPDVDAIETFIDEAELDWIGTFTYSREAGTRSFDMEQLDSDVARDRAGRLAAAADLAMERRASSLIGRTLEVLVERFDMDEGSWAGRSDREAPEVDGEIRFSCENPPSVGDYVDVRVTATDGADLVGRLAPSAAVHG